METITAFFVNNSETITPAIIATAALLVFIVLILYSKVIAVAIFPKFGFKKYAEYLPFSDVLSDGVTVRLRDGTLCRAFSFSGVQTSMKTEEDKEKLLDLRATLFNQIKDPAATLRFFTIRDKISDKTDYEFDQPTLQAIYNQWNTSGLKIFKNRYYLILSVSGANAADKISGYATFVESILAAYGAHTMRHDENDNFANLMARILSPVTKPSVPRTDANMAEMVTTDSVDFINGGVVQFANGRDKKFAAICSFKTAPDYMDEEFFDAAITVQSEMIIMNVSQIVGAAGTQNVIRQQIATADADNGEDEQVAEQVSAANYAMSENISGTQMMVNYYPCILIFGDTLDEMDADVAEFKKVCAGFGIAPVVENFAARAAWFSLIPGFDNFPRNFRMLSKTAATATPMSSVPTGVPNSDWGDGPIVVFPTAQGTPYQFQFHVSAAAGAVGHTLTIGPTGGGKTTLFSFLIAQSLRHPRLRSFFFDRNRGAEIFTLATGGKYLTFNGKTNADAEKTGFDMQLNPLKMEDTAENRAFLRRWLAMITGATDPRSLDEIARAISVNFDYLNLADRKLSNLWTSCFASDGAMRSALKKWVDELQYGSVFNEDKDTLDLFSRLTTFDFTDILADPTLAPAVISYIIQRINQLTIRRGDPSLIMIDETAPMLENKMFRDSFVTGLQEGRKNRQVYIASFQRANVLDDLGIGDVVRGQAQTVMFFRNPGANAADYAKWNLNPLELDFIAGKAYPNLKRAVLLSRPVNGESVVLNTELGGLGPLLRLFESGRPSVLLAEDLYKQYGTEFVAEYLKKQNV